MPDVCLAFNRHCWTTDMIDRPEARLEIESCSRNRCGHAEEENTGCDEPLRHCPETVSKGVRRNIARSYLLLMYFQGGC